MLGAASLTVRVSAPAHPCAFVPHYVQVMLGSRGIDRSVYGPYLLLLEPEQLAVLAMHRWGGRGGGH